MPARSGRHRPPARTDQPALEALAAGVDEAFEELTGDHPAHVLRVVNCPDGNEAELAVLPLEIGVHPAAVMAGFTAPPEWAAVGVVTAGQSHELRDPHQCKPSKGDPQRVRLTMLLGRSGAAVAFVAPLGAPHAQARVLREPPVGLLADACRRVLGLATEQPEVGPAVWLVARWLDRLLVAAIELPGTPGSWAEAAALHPLVSAGTLPAPHEVAVATAEVSSQYDWEHLRTLAERGCGNDPVVSPAVARWMDAGCFGRHLLAEELPADVVLAELAALLPAAVLAAVRAAIPAACLDRLP